MGSLIHEIRQCLHPHYISNVIISAIFFFLKTVTPFCYMLFEDCELEIREMELLTFLGCVVVLKNRKQPSFRSYFGTVCMFAKILSAFLFFRQNPIYGFLYVILCLLHIAFIPEPSYSGPDYVTYFRGPILEEEVRRDPRVTWLVEFYAAWSPQCVSFAPIFAELSAKYALENLKFGKVDVTRFPQVAERFRVSGSSWSKQLPTLILFKNGKEAMRRPQIDSSNRVLSKFIFSNENVVRDFGLNEIYNVCKKNPLKKRKGKKDLEKTADNTDNGTRVNEESDQSPEPEVGPDGKHKKE